MEIWKKILLIFSFLLLLSHCGYTPIFAVRDNAFEISKFEIHGNEELGTNILKKIKSLQNTTGENLNLIFISINVSKNKKDLVKNVSGEVISYQIEIILNIETKNITTNELIYMGNFNKKINIKKQSQESDMINLENKATEDILNNLSREIIIKINQSIEQQ